jgi:hypothetical protein
VTPVSQHGFPSGNSNMTYLERELFILSCKVADIQHYIQRINHSEICDLHPLTASCTALLAEQLSAVADSLRPT